jgi:hypothetical protein
MATQENESGGHGGKEDCPSIDDLLKKVTDDLNKYEAMKLPALKAELEAFQKKLEATVKDYEDKYPGLKEKWCTQQQVIQTLEASLKCAIPGWKEVVEDCICKPRQDIHCQSERIRRRKRCCYGALQRASEDAKAVFERAKARLDALIANVAGVQALQTENAKLITDITGYLSGDKLLALNAFFFKLLPKQKQLTPYDVSPECKTFAEDELPDKLCPCKDCIPDPDECSQPKEEPFKHKHRHPAPWLVDPKKYRHALECAWNDYHQAKDAAALADAAFKANPDDLAGLEKKLEDDKKSLDDRISKCLKGKTPEDRCCKPTDTTTAAE